jgi:hypothetical protein
MEIKLRRRPKSDFLWPMIGEPVVSAKVKQVFEENRVSGVIFCPVTAIGRASATSGDLFQMVIQAESGRPPGTEITHRCPGCGREEYDKSKRQFVLTREMIPDSNVFYLATTLWIIVNEKVRQIILDHQLTNVELTEMEYRE